MRVLFTSIPVYAHFLPGVQLAHAFAATGHEVQAVAPNGFSLANEVGFDEAGIRVVRGGISYEEGVAMVLTDYAERLGLDISTAAGTRRTAAVTFSCCFGPKLVDDLQSLFAADPPDLVLHDITEPAGAYLAGKHGIPTAAYNFGGRYPSGTDSPVEDLTELWAEKDLDIEVLEEARRTSSLLSFCPPSLQLPEARSRFQSVRPSGASLDVDSGLEEAVAAFDDRPLVYIGVGTVGNLTVLEAMVKAALELGVNVVCSLGPGKDPLSFPLSSERLQVVDFAALGWLLPRCSAAIHHGGAGTMSACFVAGCPQVLLPQAADHFFNAETVVDGGCGIALEPADVSPSAIQHALQTILEDPGHRLAADRIRSEVMAMPSPTDVAERIAAQVAERR